MAPPLTHTLQDGTITATTTGTEVRLSEQPREMQFELDVTAGGTDGTDTLDVKIQTQLDNGSWLDIAVFTQILGSAPDKTSCSLARIAIRSPAKA